MVQRCSLVSWCGVSHVVGVGGVKRSCSAAGGFKINTPADFGTFGVVVGFSFIPPSSPRVMAR